MPNYKSGFLWFPNIAAMSSLLLDSTDEDGLVFAVGIDSTTWKLATWRKSSTATIDNITIFAANGPGRWVVLETVSNLPVSNLPFVWNSGDIADWNNSSATDWNTAA
jgi:hypothetical protein